MIKYVAKIIGKPWTNVTQLAVRILLGIEEIGQYISIQNISCYESVATTWWMQMLIVSLTNSRMIHSRHRPNPEWQDFEQFTPRNWTFFTCFFLSNSFYILYQNFMYELLCLQESSIFFQLSYLLLLLLFYHGIIISCYNL